MTTDDSPSADPITAAIESSIEAATDETPDEPITEEAPETLPATGAVVAAKADTKPDIEPAKPVEKPAEKPADGEDEIDKLLTKEGFGKKAADGVRENRLPHSRVKVMIQKGMEQVKAEYEAKLTPIQQRAEMLDRLEQIAEQDADRYITMLAAANPAYRKFLAASVAPVTEKGVTAAEKPVTEKEDPIPPPNAEYSDGSKGYDADGLVKLLAWQARQVRREVTTEFEERYGPIEKDWKAAQASREQLPKIRAEVSQAKQIWGKPFEDDYALDEKSEVLAYIRKNPKVPFQVAVAAVLLPKVRTALTTDQNAMRENLLKELNERKAAASTTTPVAVTTGDRGAMGQQDDAITVAINAAIAASGLK